MIDGSGKFLPESKRGFPSPFVAFCKTFGLSSLFPKSKTFNRYHLGYLDQDETHEVDVLAGVGQIRWILAAPDSELDSDLALASDLGGPADFDRQHNPWLMPDGRLTMFDNRPPPEASRIIDLRVDEVARTATIERAYTIPSDAPAGGHCDYQGSSWRTPDGRPLATCAPVRTAYEFDPDTAEVTWSAEARCDGGSVTYIPRFVPLDW